MTTVDATMYQGEEKTIPFVITSNDVAVDISDATFTWAAWNIDTGVIITKTLDSGLAFGCPEDGQLALTLESEDTATATPTQYVHQLEMVLDGDLTIAAEGILTILKNYAL